MAAQCVSPSPCKRARRRRVRPGPAGPSGCRLAARPGSEFASPGRNGGRDHTIILTMSHETSAVFSVKLCCRRVIGTVPTGTPRRQFSYFQNQTMHGLTRSAAEKTGSFPDYYFKCHKINRNLWSGRNFVRTFVAILLVQILLVNLHNEINKAHQIMSNFLCFWASFGDRN